MTTTKKQPAKGKPEQKKPAKQVKKYTQRMKCQLTDAEKLELGQQLADLQSEGKSIENELKELKSQYKAKLDGVTARLSEVGDQLRSGYEFRPVECERTMDWAKGKITEKRLDTKEVFDERDMTDEEKQVTMDLG